MRRHGEIPPDEMAMLSELAERWRGDEPERGFSMSLGRLGDLADERCVMATALDGSGQVRALLSFVPWGRRGLSLDLMRRDPDADNGVVEFMVAGMVGAARGLGVRRLSLNFAVLRSVFSGAEQLGSGPVLRLTAAVLTFASRWWQLETLYRSNVKYRPRWDPRFICFQTGFAVNRGVIAAGVAEGFIPGPAPVGHRLRADDELAAAVRAIDAAPPVWTALTHTPRGQALVRHRKLEVLAANGVAAYPVSVPRTTSVADVRKHHHGLDPGAATGEVVSVVGRIVRLRDHGGVRFAVIREDGADVQVMLARDVLGAAAADLWGATVDRGDHVSVTGEVVTSRTGELSVQATAWTMASKCLGYRSEPRADARPGGASRPSTPGGACSPRSRGELVGRGFLEVETPMLQAVHGGANARPFVTHINAYDLDLYLRIAPELFLKRLTVSGVGRVFELNRNFRNEGVDAHPQPGVHVAGGVRGARRLRGDAPPRPIARARRRRRRPRSPDRPPPRRLAARPRRRVADRDRARRRGRGDRADDRSVDAGRGAAGGQRGSRGRRPVRRVGRRPRPAAVRRPRRAGDDDAHVLHRLPARCLAAGPTAPR